MSSWTVGRRRNRNKSSTSALFCTEVLEPRLLLSVQPIALVPSGTLSSNPDNFTSINGRVVFTATTSAAGTELWATDGTDKGTQMIADIFPGFASSAPADLVRM